MNKQLRKRVLEHATAVRQWAEAAAPGSDLMGWCAICTAEIHKRLAAEGIAAQIVMQNGIMGSHVFLMLEDWIVDVTATQFSEFRNRKVVILHERETEQFDFYEPDQVFTSVTELIAFQKKMGWPNSQTARK